MNIDHTVLANALEDGAQHTFACGTHEDIRFIAQVQKISGFWIMVPRPWYRACVKYSGKHPEPQNMLRKSV